MKKIKEYNFNPPRYHIRKKYKNEITLNYFLIAIKNVGGRFILKIMMRAVHLFFHNWICHSDHAWNHFSSHFFFLLVYYTFLELGEFHMMTETAITDSLNFISSKTITVTRYLWQLVIYYRTFISNKKEFFI